MKKSTRRNMKRHTKKRLQERYGEENINIDDLQVRVNCGYFVKLAKRVDELVTYIITYLVEVFVGGCAIICILHYTPQGGQPAIGTVLSHHVRVERTGWKAL